jgi:hypothetical protein
MEPVAVLEQELAQQQFAAAMIIGGDSPRKIPVSGSPRKIPVSVPQNFVSKLNKTFHHTVHQMHVDHQTCFMLLFLSRLSTYSPFS